MSSASSKRRKVTAGEGSTSNSFTLRIARGGASSAAAAEDEGPEVIDIDDGADEAYVEGGGEEEDGEDEAFDPSATRSKSARTRKAAGGRRGRASRASAAASDVGDEAGTDVVFLSSSAQSANNRQARQVMEDEDEDVYVDVLDDSEDRQTTNLATHDYSSLPLKADHASRPIWVCEDGRIFLETYSPLYKAAYDFLIAIADPVTRPQFIHEYQLTSYSLYAAASLGLDTEAILSGLQMFSKVALSDELCAFIHEKTARCGKAKLVLKKTRYFVESIYPDTLRALLQHPVIAEARIDLKPRATTEQLLAEEKARQEKLLTTTLYSERLALQEASKRNQNERAVRTDALANEEPEVRDEATGFLISSGATARIMLPGTASHGSKGRMADQRSAMGLSSASAAATAALDGDGDALPPPVLSFEISASSVESVRQACMSDEVNYPMLEEYDFNKDSATPDLPIALRPIAHIRDYQEKSLSKMFGCGRARSGIIVLPCGAGKSLVGITALTTVKKSCLIFCNTAVSVEQWKQQIEKWSTLPPKYIATFTAGTKDRFLTDAGREGLVVITTYNMVAFTGQRSAEAERAMDVIRKQEWGLIVLDEVHVAPAKMFRKCISITHSRCKLGLTATLVREDALIDDLFFLIGPKLYEANWLDLQAAGYIATVQCCEVWCDMTAEFYNAYLRSSLNKQMLLYVMNPNKFRCCEYLIRLHEAKGDKVLVFSDNVFALKYYARALNKPMIYGSTSDAERLQFLQLFQHDPRMNTLFISKVGDTSIDLPDVNVIIQISSHFSSRRQEAQRLGRILRPKAASTGRYNAFFYTLVSRDTKENLYATKRQRFLVDQGYSFKVVTDLPDLENIPDLHFNNKVDQVKLLGEILATDDNNNEGAEEEQDEDPFARQQKAKNKKTMAQRRTGNALDITGAGDRSYHEYEDSAAASSAKAAAKQRTPLFRQRAEQARADRRQ